MKHNSFRVLVAEDAYIVRRNIVNKILNGPYHLQLAGEASDGFTALEMIEETNPHIVLTDIRMPQMDGLELAKEIAFMYPHIKVIIISGYDNFEYAQQALKYGVCDFLLKPVSEETMNNTLDKVVVQLQKNLDEWDLHIKNKGSVNGDDIALITQTYLHDNFRKMICLTDLTDKLGYSTDYIVKVFKKHFKTTPMKYVADLRINAAKHILINEDKYDIKGIAEYLGFSDPLYFSRVFKKKTGFYPSVYRDEKRNDSSDSALSS